MAFPEWLAFDKPVRVRDEAGGEKRSWEPVFEARGRFRFLRGGETVQAARLEGRQPVVVRIPISPDARAVTSDWHMRDLLTEVSYNVKTAVPTDDRREIELTCESGVAI